MKPLVAISLLALGVTHGSSATAGTITGRVDVVKDRKTVAHDGVWVYLEDLKPRRRKPPNAAKPQSREIRQFKTQFSPQVLVVPVGTTVAFPNFDVVEHNVFSPTDPPGQFDLGRYNRDLKGKTHEFLDPAEMEIYCDVHKEMWARVKVVNSEFIAPVIKGQFSIEGVPPGSYKVHAWTRNSAEVLETIEVIEGKTSTTHDLHLQLGELRPHLNKNGMHYPPYKP